MSTAIEIPITIEPEAAAQVAEWGLEREMEMMVEKMRQTVPDLRRISVCMDPGAFETSDQPNVVIWAWRPHTAGPDREIQDELFQWSLANYSDDVRWVISMIISYEVDNGR